MSKKLLFSAREIAGEKYIAILMRQYFDKEDSPRDKYRVFSLKKGGEPSVCGAQNKRSYREIAAAFIIRQDVSLCFLLFIPPKCSFPERR